MSEIETSLSPEGRQRCEQILSLAIAEARHRRRRRVLVRIALAALAIAVLIPQALRIRPPQNASIAVKPHERRPMPPAQPPVLVSRIATDPHIVERLAIPRQPSHVIVIGDGELLRELAQAHQPAGLAYVNGKAMLLFR